METGFALDPGVRLGKSRFVEAAAHVRLKEEAQRRARVAVSVGFQAAPVELLRPVAPGREWALDEASQARYHSLHVVLSAPLLLHTRHAQCVQAVTAKELARGAKGD